MAQGPDGKTIIIVKKVSGHGGHHGGAWKVAYADFVTSMMAFFMVLWLVNSASVTVRERIASYFRAPGVFEKGSGTPIETGGAGILPDTFAPPADEEAQVQLNSKIYDASGETGQRRDSFGQGGGEGAESLGKPEDEKKAMEKLLEELQSAVSQDKQTILGFIGQIEVKLDQRGLHLEIMDTPQASMFQRGSAVIQGPAEAELKKIADILNGFPNPIDIEGHTDAAPYRGKAAENYDNWNLSTDRANAARRILRSAGIPDSRVARVVGYADQRLKVPSDPLMASNRRISISMRYTKQAAKLLEDTQVTETKAVPIIPPKTAEAPPPPSARKEPKARVYIPRDASGRPLAAEEVTTSGLKVEVNTSQPEPPGIQEEQPDERPAEPWLEKDKIFDSKNPFFTK